ncbi:MAG TPA: pyridoxamine 5'-phosphate oxidase [Acidocella sp.]|nr:pyridoxamine 5'-phosphate oxidase [Acidocella sp.]
MEKDPFTKFGVWLAEAEATEPNDPNAVIVSTASPSGRPASRTLLLKAWDDQGFVFFGNLGSRKASEMHENPQVALLFYWKILHRQIRIEGAVTPVSADVADAYFATRPRVSQLGAWASKQSQPLASRAVFEERLKEAESRFSGQDVPRPDFWSGWRLAPDYFEFWQAVDFRLHDRQTFTRSGAAWESGALFP